MKIEKKTQTILGCDKSYEESVIVLFGAPFDSTTSNRPGARFASAAIRSESDGMETYSPYQDRDLTDIYVMDSGDLELPFGDPEPALQMIEAYVGQLLTDKKIPGMIGGEHLVTLGAMRAMVKQYDDLHIIHFDAHTDLREDYLGQTLSHATVMRRCHDLVGDGRIFQFGIRSGLREEFSFAKEHQFLKKFDLKGIDTVAQALADKPVYLTVDLDVLDPACFPGTGTPEAGGVSFKELLLALNELAGLNIVGFDLNELSPMLDPSGASTALACKVLREMLFYVHKNKVYTMKVKPAQAEEKENPVETEKK